MKRIYQSLLEEHFSLNSQMAFMLGPRQVGKTTLAKSLSDHYKVHAYLNWDIPKDRELILQGPEAVLSMVMSARLDAKAETLIALDEIHKMKNCKNYLKGYYDSSAKTIKTLVAGSARLDIFKHAGDSLMGRYLLYHIHPFSVGELLERAYQPIELREPAPLSEELWQALYKFGGFPGPLFKQSQRFLNQWQTLRFQQLFEEEIRTLTHVSAISLLETLARHLSYQVGGQVNYANLANKIQVDAKTVKSWIVLLEAFYFCFTIKPWSKNVARSLLKEPRVYLWDWSAIDDKGARIENFMAAHLLKAVNFWTDIGLGQYALYYLRDKDQREADFLVTKNDKPFMLLQIKSSEHSLSSSLLHFQKQVQAEHVFQVNFEMPYIDKDCFAVKKPVIVPARTLLSQLV